MERKSFYFKQPVSFTELNAAFQGAENAINQLVVDYALSGIVTGLVPVQNPGGPALNVSVTTGLAYDNTGERVFVPTAQVVDCSVDQGSVSTTVSIPTFSRIISVCVKFARVLSDPRTDGNGSTVYFEQAESFAFKVVAGVAALSPTAPSIPANYILLSDVTIAYGQTTIVNGNISYARAVTVTRAPANEVSAQASTGTRFSTTAGTVQSQLNAIRVALDSLESNGADTIKQFASIAALRATAAAPAYATDAVCAVPGFGLFVWAAASTATDDGLFVVTPTGVATGRWLSLTSQLGAANGLAQNDATGRVAAAKVRNGIIDQQVLTNNSGYTGAIANRVTASLADTGLALNFTAVAGDVIRATCQVATTTDPSGTGFIALSAQDGGVDSPHAETLCKVIGTTDAIVHTLHVSHTVANTGAVAIKLRFEGDGSHNLYIMGALSFSGQQVRP